MAELVWHNSGNKHYETGISNVVLYVRDAAGAYPMGVAWNGVISITESPEGGESNPLYADNVKYLSLTSAEMLKASIEAFSSPPEFDQCDGIAALGVGVFAGQQTRKPFGLAYKTKIGNDTEGEDHGYKLHLLYNIKAAPTEKGYQTINDSPEAITFTWELDTNPEPISTQGFIPTSLLVIDSTLADSVKLQTLEDQLFGTAIIDPNLPLPDAVAAIFA